MQEQREQLSTTTEVLDPLDLPETPALPESLVPPDEQVLLVPQELRELLE